MSIKMGTVTRFTGANAVTLARLECAAVVAHYQRSAVEEEAFFDEATTTWPSFTGKELPGSWSMRTRCS